MYPPDKNFMADLQRGLIGSDQYPPPEATSGRSDANIPTSPGNGVLHVSGVTIVPTENMSPKDGEQSGRSQTGRSFGEYRRGTRPHLSRVFHANDVDLMTVNSSGLRHASTVLRSEIRRLTNLPLRDMLFLEDAMLYNLNTVLVRPKMKRIVIKIDHISSIITEDCLILFLPASRMDRKVVVNVAKNLEQLLQEHEHCAEHTAVPFSIQAIETILDSVCEHFDKSRAALTPLVQQLLNEMQGDAMHAGEVALSRMLAMKKSLVTFEGKVNDAIQMVQDEMLGSDESIEGLCLGYEPASQDELEWVMEEAEIMISNYWRRLQHTQKALSELDDNIDDTQEIIKINLDSMRNRVLRLDLNVSFIGMALGFGAVFTGMFGMNLSSEINEIELLFWWVSGIIAVICVGTYLVALYKKRKLFTPTKTDHHVLLTLFDYVQDLEKLLKEHGSVTAVELLQLLTDAVSQTNSVRQPPKEELKNIVDLLFRVYDQNHDGKIEIHEVLDSAKQAGIGPVGHHHEDEEPPPRLTRLRSFGQHDARPETVRRISSLEDRPQTKTGKGVFFA